MDLFAALIRSLLSVPANQKSAVNWRPAATFRTLRLPLQEATKDTVVGQPRALAAALGASDSTETGAAVRQTRL